MEGKHRGKKEKMIPNPQQPKIKGRLELQRWALDLICSISILLQVLLYETAYIYSYGASGTLSSGDPLTKEVERLRRWVN